MALNVRLLKKVRDAIARTRVGARRRFDMSWWAEESDGPLLNTVEELCTSVKRADAGECKTTCCIAGHVVLQASAHTRKKHRVGKQSEISVAARKLLGIDRTEAYHLFQGIWSDAGGPSPDTTRREAVAYLDRCIAAKEIVRDNA